MQASSARQQRPTPSPPQDPQTSHLAACAVVEAAKALDLAVDGFISIPLTQLEEYFRKRKREADAIGQALLSRGSTKLEIWLFAYLPCADFRVELIGEGAGVSSLPGQWQKYQDEASADSSAASASPRVELQQPKQVTLSSSQ